ncbi:U2 small nuclear ribonucleoprotein B [Balamuthia mandrillaris]
MMATESVVEERNGPSSSATATNEQDSETIPPNETLYVNNLNERVKKEELRRSLYTLFSQYGTVLDVLAKKTLKMRGQAFVIFRELSAATNALRNLNEFMFYDKPMKVQYAKTRSDLVAKIKGTWEPREKRPRPPQDKKPKQPKKKKKKVATGEEEDEKDTKKTTTAASSASAPSSTSSTPHLPQPKQQPPHKKLFVENLPEQANELMLSMLFRQYPGFQEVRMVPGGKGMAFVEFGNEMESAIAKEALQYFKITPQHPMVISFAKGN